MRIIHSSDWHLGQFWSGRSRKREFQAFLDWLLQEMDDRDVDLLIVAGDIFDTSTPSPESQSMYYDFLTRLSARRRRAVIVAGNHDSPFLLDAPKKLLHFLDIHVVGTVSMPENELVVIPGDDAAAPPKLIVAAVPFLRDRDIKRAAEGETLEESDNRTAAGIRLHYENVCRAAEEIRKQYPGAEIPLVVTGHLFADKHFVEKEEGGRRIHVGTLGQVGSDIFPDGIDYLALGHIHRASRLGGKDFFRYSGSPIPMSFGEAGHEKAVVQVDFEGRTPKVESVPVPGFSDIRSIKGDLETILKQLGELNDESDRDAFVEVVYTGSEPVHDLTEQVHAIVTRENIEVVQVRDGRIDSLPKIQAKPGVQLEDLNPVDVFEQLLEEHEKAGLDYDPEFRHGLLMAYREILEQCEHPE